MSDSAFDKLSKINVTEHIEKKGQFSYLSWPFAISEISKVDPSVTWEFPSPVTYPDGTMMVFCNVTSGGRTLPAFLPVMDNRNKAIANPNAFDINKAYQRCLVKGIALFGLGLYIYAGEDLPEGDPPPKPTSVAKSEFDKMEPDQQQFLRNLAMDVMAGVDDMAIAAAYQKTKLTLDSDEQVAFWSLFDSKQSAAIKRGTVTPTEVAK